VAVEGNVLLLKPFLELSFDGVIRWKSLALEIFSVCQTRESLRGPSWGCVVVVKVQKWLQEQDISFYHQGLENLIVCYDRCLNKFGDCLEK
jgi:hypothetical protein